MEVRTVDNDQEVLGITCHDGAKDNQESSFQPIQWLPTEAEPGTWAMPWDIE
jgi:hypothetical protein